jgi:hypothetical protein
VLSYILRLHIGLSVQASIKFYNVVYEILFFLFFIHKASYFDLFQYHNFLITQGVT